jgi:hypothetical protein
MMAVGANKQTPEVILNGFVTIYGQAGKHYLLLFYIKCMLFVLQVQPLFCVGVKLGL